MDRFVLCVLGSSGSGKSYLIRELINSGGLPEPVFILDTEADFSVGMIFQETADFWEYYRADGMNASGIYTIRCDSAEDADLFLRIVWELGERCTVVLDEVDKHGDRWNVHPDIARMISYGRKRGISMILAARRPSEVSPVIRAQATWLVTFRQTEPIDLKRLSERGLDPDTVSNLPQYRTAIQGDLELLHFWKWRDILLSSVDPDHETVT